MLVLAALLSGLKAALRLLLIMALVGLILGLAGHWFRLGDGGAQPG
ncbi:MAG: hypothetical protein ACYDEA_02635 [Candidatus Dormibacteria bacterium]